MFLFMMMNPLILIHFSGLFLKVLIIDWTFIIIAIVRDFNLWCKVVDKLSCNGYVLKYTS